MENAEEVLQSLDSFSKLKPKDIPRELEEYLCFVARTGDPMYQWSLIKCLFREKLLQVLTEFHDTTPGLDLPPCPNVDPFNYDTMKNCLLERIEGFPSAPFTVQRICELLTAPRKQYSRIDKYMRAIEKNILVVSTREPGQRRSESENGNPFDGVVNGDDSDVHVEIEMEEPTWRAHTTQDFPVLHEPHDSTTSLIETVITCRSEQPDVEPSTMSMEAVTHDVEDQPSVFDEPSQDASPELTVMPDLPDEPTETLPSSHTSLNEQSEVNITCSETLEDNISASEPVPVLVNISLPESEPEPKPVIMESIVAAVLPDEIPIKVLEEVTEQLNDTAKEVDVLEENNIHEPESHTQPDHAILLEQTDIPEIKDYESGKDSIAPKEEITCTETKNESQVNLSEPAEETSEQITLPKDLREEPVFEIDAASILVEPKETVVIEEIEPVQEHAVAPAAEIESESPQIEQDTSIVELKTQVDDVDVVEAILDTNKTDADHMTELVDCNMETKVEDSNSSDKTMAAESIETDELAMEVEDFPAEEPMDQ